MRREQTHKTSASVELLNTAREIYLNHPAGLRDQELAELMNVSRATAHRYRKMLNTDRVVPSVYRYIPTREEIILARAILIAAGE